MLPLNNLLSVQVPIKPTHKQTLSLRLGHMELDLWDRQYSHNNIHLTHMCWLFSTRLDSSTHWWINAEQKTAPRRGWARGSQAQEAEGEAGILAQPFALPLWLRRNQLTYLLNNFISSSLKYMLKNLALSYSFVK